MVIARKGKASDKAAEEGGGERGRRTDGRERLVFGYQTTI